MKLLPLAALILGLALPTLSEPNASWVEALEAEWLKRNGSR